MPNRNISMNDIIILRELKCQELFPTGLVISPSHEETHPDVNPANVDALFKAVKET